VIPLIHSPLSASLTLLAVWGLIGLLGLLRPRSVGLAGRTLFPLGALCGILLALVALASLAAPLEQRTLLIGLPDLPMQFIEQLALPGFSRHRG
jgi:hydrogenase-4 component B